MSTSNQLTIDRRSLLLTGAAMFLSGCGNKPAIPTGETGLILPQIDSRDFPNKLVNDVAIPRGFELVPQTDAMREWKQKLTNIAKQTVNRQGGLRHQATFLHESSIGYLNSFVGQSVEDKGSKVTFVKYDPPRWGYRYGFEVKYADGKDERWYVSQEPRYSDQFPKVEERNRAQIAIWAADENGRVDRFTQGSFPVHSIFNLDKRLHPDIFGEFAYARKFREQEVQDPANARGFDLPRHKPIGFINFIGLNAESDPIIAGSIEFCEHLGGFMNSLGYHFVIPKGAPAVTRISARPIAELRRQLVLFEQVGIDCCFVHLTGHGGPSGVDFEVAKGTVSLGSRETVESFAKFPNMSVITSTGTCGGAGFVGKLIDIDLLRGPRKPLHFFTQCKPIGITQEGRSTGGSDAAPKVMPSYYDVFLIHYLQQNLPYGLAHIYADSVAKQLAPNDAEYLRVDEKGVLHRTSYRADLDQKLNGRRV